MLKSFLDSKTKLKSFLKFLFPPFLTLLILLALFAHFKITPFGNNTMATMDGNIQYVDYFDYYKGVLDGKNTLGYTFSKEIGGNMLGAFSYYLASPINLLLKFFPEDKIELFFTFAVTVRLMLASFTFFIFLDKRFKKNSSTKTYFVFVLFSLFYALSSYSFQQSSNLMWLDGVWLLPLMMLGVSKIFDKKSPKLFIISSACAFIFNWYSGFIAFLFCAFYFLAEFILRSFGQKLKAKDLLKSFWGYAWRFVLSTIVALLISSIILVPSFKALGEGSRGGGADWGALHFGFRGKLTSTAAEYYPGTNSGSKTLSVFVGAFSLLVFISVFISKKVKISKKIAYFFILLATLLLFYSGPVYFVFSLLKDVNSYWVRFSFGCFAILLFLAAYIFKNEEIKPKTYTLSAIIFFLICLGFEYIREPVKLRFFYGLFVIVFAVVFYLHYIAKSSRVKTALFVLLSLMTLGEIVLNAGIVLDNFNNTDKFTDYTVSQSETIEKLKSSDDSAYRVHNLTQRCGFCLNDGLAHNYNSIDGYTSSPDDKEIKLLNSLGYKRWFYQSNITKDPILSSDSLLGVKYYVDEGKIIENTYALPLVFSVPNTSAEKLAKIEYEDNTFTFQNEIYKALSGIDEDIYKKVSFTREIKDKKIIYYLDLNEADNKLFYGQVSTKGTHGFTFFDGEENKTSAYSTHSGPSVVKISSKTVTLELKNEDDTLDESNIEEEFFYYLDLKVFERIINKIKSENKVSDFSFSNQKISFTLDSETPQTIFTSIHSQNGWEIAVNGKKIKPAIFDNSFITFDLESGKNDVKIEFHIPGFKLGIALFVLGVILFIVISRFTS